MSFRRDPFVARFGRRATAALLFACAIGVCPIARAADARVGGADATVDAAKLDDAWPDMKEWAAAGVRGGIPLRAAGKVVRTVKPGEDVQAAVDAAATGGGGVVTLAVGVHPLLKRLNLRSNVVLRGEERGGRSSSARSSRRSPATSSWPFGSTGRRARGWRT